MNTAADVFFFVSYFSDCPLATNHEEDLHVFHEKASGVTNQMLRDPVVFFFNIYILSIFNLNPQMMRSL